MDAARPAGAGAAGPGSTEPQPGWRPAEPDREIRGVRPADPDLAARARQRLGEAASRTPADRDLLAEVDADPVWRGRLTAVLGASEALGDHLAAHPDQVRLLAGPLPADPTAQQWAGGSADPTAPWLGGSGEPATDPSGAVPAGPLPGDGTVAGLRLAYRGSLLRIAAGDLTGELSTERAMAALSRLADATLAAAFTLAGGRPEHQLAVIAMGKCGGRELNYVSDVDVIFVAGDDAELAPATGIATRLIEICGRVAWPVDAALRPEGSRGPLVRTLRSHLAYYTRWARTWEFQALLKARPAAGDLDLGRRWLAELQPLIWQAAERPEAVDDIRAMRRRVIDAVPAAQRDREIKRGPGGLRDIEFAVQLLQLVHGRADESLRSPSTLDALRALTDGGYVGREDGKALAAGYVFLRTVEHRLQLRRLRRTHTVPADPAEFTVLAQTLGYPPGEAVARLRADWVAHAGQVRRLHAKLLYRPLLAAVARVPGDDLRLTPDAARARLEALGFADPAGALRHIQALTGGVSRAAAIQRQLLPVLLSQFADAPEPDRGLLAYRRVSEALRDTPWYLRLLRDGGPVALRLAGLLGLSRYLTDLLIRDPEALRLLASDAELVPRPAQVLRDGFAAAAARHADPVAAIGAVRALRRRELFRVAAADLLGLLPVEQVGQALSDVTDATLAAALAVTIQPGPARQPGPVGDAGTAGGAGTVGGAGLRFAIIGMGRLGGYEMSYPSDADVLFVYDPPSGMPDDEASGVAHRIAGELRRLLSLPAPDPPLGVDADLRPEGRQGPLVRSLAAYRQYYGRWSRVWEAQALLRARYVAGDTGLAARFLELIDPVRYPVGGLRPEQVTEIRRIKARVDSERLPRGADPATHTKLGRGGLADVEWTVQLCQLGYGRANAELRTTRTLAALSAAADIGLLGGADATALAAAWVSASRVRNALTLVRGRPSDQLPRQGVELAGVVDVLHRRADTGTAATADVESGPSGSVGPGGVGSDRGVGTVGAVPGGGAGLGGAVPGGSAGPGADPGRFVDGYLRTARRARQVFERVFQDFPTRASGSRDTPRGS